VLAGAIGLRADSISDTSESDWQFSSLAGASADLSGWFYNSTGPLFPSQTDLSQPWTSAANIALMNSWLDLVTQAEASSDPAALASLIGLGMYDSPGSSSTQAAPSAPEPALLGTLGSGLALLALYAVLRLRRPA
jgi:hypothetical protein